MAHSEQFEAGTEAGAEAVPKEGISRRKVITTGATLAVAGVAVGAAGTLAVSAVGGGSGEAKAGQAPTDPVMVHLKDANSGQFDIFVGERRGSFTDRAMAAQLVQAAANAN